MSTALENLLEAARAFAIERYTEMAEWERGVVDEATALGAVVEVRIAPEAECRVRMLLVSPDGSKELPLGRLVERHQH